MKIDDYENHGGDGDCDCGSGGGDYNNKLKL
jgi:hypothetical protein